MHTKNPLSDLSKDTLKILSEDSNPRNSTQPLNRVQNNPFRKQQTRLSVDRPYAPVDRAGRPVTCTCCFSAAVLLLPSSFCHRLPWRSLDDPSTILVNFLSDTSLFPTILHLGEDFPNLSRSPTYPSLSPGEIDTRSRQNRHTISAWNP